jgi:hypothetical protein
MVNYLDKSGSIRIHFRGDHEVRILRLDSKQICPKCFLDCFLDRQYRERQDNIFAFLNLFSDNIWQQIPICYNTSGHELLLYTARSVIEWTQSLYIIVIRGR